MAVISLTVGPACSAGGHWVVTMAVPGVGRHTFPVYSSDGEQITEEDYLAALETIVKYDNLRTGTAVSRRAKMDGKQMGTEPR